MSRFHRQTSYGHTVRRIAHDHYRLHWTVDRYYPDSNLRHPTAYRRDTDRAGALRFAKRHNVEIKGET